MYLENYGINHDIPDMIQLFDFYVFIPVGGGELLILYEDDDRRFYAQELFNKHKLRRR